MDLAFVQRSLPELLNGAAITAQLACVSLLGAGLGGLAVASARRSQWRPLRTCTGAYVEVMRNTPILVQLAILYFGLPSLGLYPDAFTAAATALMLQNAAYSGEVYRSALASIARGQSEAAAALGLRPLVVYWRVVLPQAFRRALPALGNQAVALVKDTSVASTIALVELTSTGKLMLDRSAAPYETFLLIALLYLALNLCVLGLLKLVAHHLPVRT